MFRFVSIPLVDPSVHEVVVRLQSLLINKEFYETFPVTMLDAEKVPAAPTTSMIIPGKMKRFAVTPMVKKLKNTLPGFP